MPAEAAADPVVAAVRVAVHLVEIAQLLHQQILQAELTLVAEAAAEVHKDLRDHGEQLEVQE
jgi:hypothetical protein